MGEKVSTADIHLCETELPILRVAKNDANWTLITTRRIIGVLNGQRTEMEVDQIDDYIVGLPKSTTHDFGVFRANDFYGVHKDFIMEAGYGRQAVIEALRFLIRSGKNEL